ncbi:MAG: hypothetical protein AVO35_05045 [Candidatus Aegiribacteria sp. MLS_C]|nr:MAG: hypothetical protein AVO35_05045 [Candidatus Aegiribacteria sp. MLS_C]
MVTAGVVGATGLVGETMIEIIQDRSFPVSSFRAFASERSEGQKVRFLGAEYPVEIITPETLCKGMLLFGATSADVARMWVPACRRSGAIIIDNSSAFRMDPSVPLVVPEVNGHHLDGTEDLIANPNCSTIQLVVTLGPLSEMGRMQWVSVATYQAVSGAGREALDELSMQQRGHVAPEGSVRLHENVVTSIGDPASDGYCEEEVKLMKETCKIMGIEIPIYASTARVPVRTGHTEAVTVRFDEPVDARKAADILRSAPGLTLSEHGAAPLDSEGTDSVIVDRLRVNPADSRALQFWVIADNLRKGAALNAVQIAEVWLAAAEKGGRR